MKKIYTFFALLLLCAVTAVAQTTIYSQGTQVTSTDGLLDGNKYVIRVSGGSYITESNSQYVAPNTTQNSITSAAVFTFKAIYGQLLGNTHRQCHRHILDSYRRECRRLDVLFQQQQFCGTIQWLLHQPFEWRHAWMDWYYRTAALQR